jgi:hypothetical protein
MIMFILCKTILKVLLVVPKGDYLFEHFLIQMDSIKHLVWRVCSLFALLKPGMIPNLRDSVPGLWISVQNSCKYVNSSP